MHQSLHVLQLPLYELAEWVTKEIENNPLLEFTNEKDPSYSRFALENSPITSCSLFEHLMSQAYQTFDSKEEIDLAEQIIGNLDERGFLSLPLNEEAIYNQSLYSSTLTAIQSFDPIGIAAYNLQHSFLLQLKYQNKENSLSYLIIKEYYDDLLHNRLLFLSQKLGCALKEIKKIIQEEIKSLNIHPGYSFRNEITPYVYPDIIITREEELYPIEVNESLIPSFRIKSNENQENLCLQPYLHHANRLVYILNKRKKTLQAVGDYLFKRQKPFFLENNPHLNPMTLKEVAESIGLHESTISRAIADKYLSCSQGIFSLRKLFSTVTKNDSGEEVSAQMVKQQLSQLINNENKKFPYSDEALAKQLKQLGQSCSRRTIAKYRHLLNIPHSSLRRKW